MPLRADLNAELLAWLSPTALRRLNDTWRGRGFGHPDEIIEDVARFLGEDAFDYEALLAHLEVRYLDDARAGFAQAYHAFHAWLAQVVYLMLYRRQVERRNSYREGLQYFEGLVPLARQNRPLWILSLNQDVLVECIAALFGVRRASGPGRAERHPGCCGHGQERMEGHSGQVLAGVEPELIRPLARLAVRPSFGLARVSPFAFPPPRPGEVTGNSSCTQLAGALADGRRHRAPRVGKSNEISFTEQHPGYRDSLG
jgi:hypothetical protein